MSHNVPITRLPRIEPARARLQTTLLAALDGARHGEIVLSATTSDAVPAAAIGFDTPVGRVELAPLIADGAVPLLVADDGAPDAVGAVDALARIEPLVAAIELTLGVALRPTSVAAPALPVRLKIDVLDDDGRVRHAAILGVADDARFDLAPAPFDAVRAARLRVGWTLHLAGPRLAPWQMAALDPGDLVLVGGRELAGTIHAAGRTLPARLRPDTATLTVADHQGSSMTDAPNLDADMRLPLTLVIDGGTASLGDISRLTAGSVLPLGLEGAALPVTLTIGGDAVAAGELVAVGEAYAVLVTRRIG